MPVSVILGSQALPLSALPFYHEIQWDDTPLSRHIPRVTRGLWTMD